MKLPDKIKSIDEFNEVTTVINKSTFIARVYPVTSESEIKENLSKTKKKFYTASHHCYAFRLADDTIRYSDAGEPNGTAGIRILNAIEHFKLSNQLVIVSRIFGGVKLGVGPLGKAYYQSAFNLFEKSKISTKQLFQKATISTIYDQISPVSRILSVHNNIIVDSDYKETIKLNCLLIPKEIDLISKKITELGNSSTSIILQQEVVYK